LSGAGRVAVFRGPCDLHHHSRADEEIALIDAEVAQQRLLSLAAGNRTHAT
jgi:hypothetical protein